jgi:hypothetical protein
MKKKGKEWLIDNKEYSYADNKKVARLLYGLSRLKIVDKKTKNAKKYEYLGLRGLSKKDSRAFLVSIRGDKYKNKDILFGDTKSDASSMVYARYSNKKQSYLVSNYTRISSSKDGFALKEITIFPFKDVKKIYLVKDKKYIDKNSSGKWHYKKAIDQSSVTSMLLNIADIDISNHIAKKNPKRVKDVLKVFLSDKIVTIGYIKLKKDYYMSVKGSKIDILENRYIKIPNLKEIKKIKLKTFIQKKDKKKK